MSSSTNIKSLKDLREAKRNLKNELHSNTSQNSTLINSFNFLNKTVSRNNTLNDTAIGANVLNSLNFVSEKIQQKYKLGKVSQLAVSGAIILIAPIIAKKIESFIDKRIK